MEVNDLDRLVEEREKEIKRQKSQIAYGLFVLGLVLLIVISLFKGYYIYSICLGIGTLIGIILRYSRFCFASAFREPFITGNTKVIRAVILGLIVSSIGFAISWPKTMQGSINGFGNNLMLGAFMFGLGMTLAGGCVTGLLMKIGEGHSVFLIVFLGFILGSSIGGRRGNSSKIVFLPDYLDIRQLAFIQVSILVILYLLALYYEKRKRK